MSLALLFHYLMLNMFWMLIHPSSGAGDVFVELLHGLYLLWFDVCWCNVVVWLGWCGILMQAKAILNYQDDAWSNKHKMAFAASLLRWVTQCLTEGLVSYPVNPLSLGNYYFCMYVYDDNLLKHCYSAVTYLLIMVLKFQCLYVWITALCYLSPNSTSWNSFMSF